MMGMGRTFKVYRDGEYVGVAVAADLPDGVELAPQETDLGTITFVAETISIGVALAGAFDEFVEKWEGACRAPGPGLMVVHDDGRPAFPALREKIRPDVVRERRRKDWLDRQYRRPRGKRK